MNTALATEMRVPAGEGMKTSLAAEMDVLASVGWRVQSQTETTASLETRGPFNWWILLFCLVFFPIVGSAIYILWWLIFDQHHLFVRVENEQMISSGDTWLVDRQMGNLERARQIQREIKQRGFFAAAGPSILGLVVAVAIWFAIIWVFIRYIV